MGERWYFAYGSNMSPKVLRRRRVRPLSAEAARLAEHRLTFGLRGWGWVEPGFADVEPQEREVVHGVLYRLSEEDLRRIDRSEGPGYTRVSREVQGARSGRVSAELYRARAPRAGLIPSRRYLELLVSGARHHGLPADYIEGLRAHPSRYVPGLSELLPTFVHGGIYLGRALGLLRGARSEEE